METVSHNGQMRSWGQNDAKDRPLLLKRAAPILSAAKPFLTGSIAGCFATTAIQPMDMVKVRLQLSASPGVSPSPIAIASHIVRNEGVGAMYAGLSASLTRQVVYTGTRIGFFDKFVDVARERNGHGPLSLATTCACALSAGGLAAVLGNPADLSLIRMQADSTLPAAEQRGYSSVISAFSSIVRHEGVVGLFQGASPTAARAMGMNLGMLAGNMEAKKHLGSAGLEGNVLVFSASAVAGVFAAACSLPFDYVKTLLQRQHPDAQGILPYKGAIDCALQTLREGGPTRFYTGFGTYLARVVPHAMLTLIAADRLKQLWKKLDI